LARCPRLRFELMVIIEPSVMRVRMPLHGIPESGSRRLHTVAAKGPPLRSKVGVVGNLMEALDMYPPRYRVRAFPSEEQLVRMVREHRAEQ
jgi:hypothetical protein